MSETTTYKVFGGVKFLLKLETVDGYHAELEELVYSCTICGRELSSRGSAGWHARTHDE